MKIVIENYSSAGKFFPDPIGVIPGESVGEKAVEREIEEKDFKAWKKLLNDNGLPVSSEGAKEEKEDPKSEQAPTKEEKEDPKKNNKKGKR